MNQLGQSMTRKLLLLFPLLRLPRRADFLAPGVEFGEEAVTIFGALGGEVFGFAGVVGEVVEANEDAGQGRGLKLGS